ncbi:hypothetical protein C1645_871298 [Glomus cerebriforme]|uniref:Uncharacterized protein n=1 Tax=Glomus cerebriforme TaxID=658196 RepID=A0A397TM67_9GLOM|nr:hypothetical protein C1645_871298 [Glomus cerebriforme]
MHRATPKTKIDAREGFKLSSEYTNKKNLPSKIDTQKNKNDAWEDPKVLSEHTNEKNSPNRTDILNIKSIVRVVLNSKKLPIIIIILAFVGVPNIKRIVRDLLRPKKLSLIIMTFLGVYAVRDYIMWQDRKKDYTVIHIMRIILRRLLQDQGSDEETLNNSDKETYKNETYENELKNSGSAKIDGNSNPNNPASTLDDDNRSPVASKYDPNLDYEKLVCEYFYEELKGNPFVEDMMNRIRKNYGEL